MNSVKTNRELLIEKWSSPEREAISKAMDTWTSLSGDVDDDASTDEQLAHNERILFFMLREAEIIKSLQPVLDKDDIEYTIPGDILSSTLFELANHFYSTGDMVKALTFAERSLFVYEDTFGKCDDTYDEIAILLANIYVPLHFHEEMEALSHRHIALLEERYGSESPKIDFALHGLSQAYEEQGKYPEALAVSKRILAINLKAYGESDERTVDARKTLSDLIEDPETCLCRECGYSLQSGSPTSS